VLLSRFVLRFLLWYLLVTRVEVLEVGAVEVLVHVVMVWSWLLP
jgi:hypothetical protein